MIFQILKQGFSIRRNCIFAIRTAVFGVIAAVYGPRRERVQFAARGGVVVGGVRRTNYIPIPAVELYQFYSVFSEPVFFRGAGAGRVPTGRGIGRGYDEAGV